MISENEIIEMVEAGDINFLAAAITPWHAHGISAYIYQMNQKKILLKGFIMVVAHAETGKAIDETNFYVDTCNDITIVEISPDQVHRNIWEKVEIKFKKYAYYMRGNTAANSTSTLYWAVPYKPSYELIPKIDNKKLGKKVQIILTDEGVGTYTNTNWTTLKSYIYEQKRKKLLRNIWQLFIRDKYFLYRLKKRKQIEYNQLFVKSRNHIKSNQTVCNAYRYILEQQETTNEFSYYEGSVVINSDLYSEMGLIKNNNDLDIFKKICGYFNNKDIKVILKPHPREKNIERYTILECIIEKKSYVSQEKILASLRVPPICIMSLCSTTMVSAKSIYGIRAVALNKMLAKENVINRNNFEDFNRVFSEMLEIPDGMQQLEKIMKQIVGIERIQN